MFDGLCVLLAFVVLCVVVAFLCVCVCLCLLLCVLVCVFCCVCFVRFMWCIVSLLLFVFDIFG